MCLKSNGGQNWSFQKVIKILSTSVASLNDVNGRSILQNNWSSSFLVVFYIFKHKSPTT